MKKQIKVAYFPSTATKAIVLGSNGKSLDRYCIKCDTDEDLTTGNYILDATFLIENNLQDLLQEEVILKVLMDYGEEIFRISKVAVGTRYIDVVARQITISDSLNLWLEDVRPTDMSGSGAAGYLVSNATGAKEIEVISDVQSISTAYYMRMNLYKALHDTEQSFLNRWGGEVLRRGYIEYINKNIGIDRGFTIREGKNLTGFECSSNIDSLVTRAKGQGYDGILGNYIDSPLIGSYNRIYTEVIKYEDVKVKDENNKEGYNTLEQAQAELNRRIKEEYSKNGIDKIKANYTINFVQLEKTEEYKDYIVAERVYLGDTIRVYIPKLNTDIKVRAIAKKYDVLAQKTKEIKLSNYIQPKPLSIKQIIDKLESIDSTDTILQQAKDNATNLINAGMKNSYVIVKQNEILIMDTKDINTATKVWRFNNGGLGYSSTSYYGTYDTAITQDGSIVANFITTGVLNANLIKTGAITSKNGKVALNLDNGNLDVTGGAFTLTNSNGTVVIDGSSNMFKIHATVDLSLDAGSNLDYAYTYTHGLGFVPAFLGFQVDTPSSIGGNVQLPAFSVGGSGASLEFTSIIRATADSNSIKINYKRANTTIRSDFKVRIFIYKEALI
ncbi:phage tail spike protein [Clostridium sp.]|uniref:phage tail spike protein n=1 Tax=Clostridium sp. TaxID=1506 RepID=UPI0032172CF2